MNFNHCLVGSKTKHMQWEGTRSWLLPEHVGLLPSNSFPSSPASEEVIKMKCWPCRWLPESSPSLPFPVSISASYWSSAKEKTECALHSEPQISETWNHKSIYLENKSRRAIFNLSHQWVHLVTTWMYVSHGNNTEGSMVLLRTRHRYGLEDTKVYYSSGTTFLPRDPIYTQSPGSTFLCLVFKARPDECLREGKTSSKQIERWLMLHLWVNCYPRGHCHRLHLLVIRPAVTLLETEMCA